MQAFDENGWNYIRKLEEVSSMIKTSGVLDREFMLSVDCILKTGKADCDVAEDMSDRLNEVLTLITSFKLPTQSPTISISPTEAPTDVPTGEFTEQCLIM